MAALPARSQLWSFRSRFFAHCINETIAEVSYQELLPSANTGGATQRCRRAAGESAAAAMGAATTAAATGRASLRALAALAVAWREAATAARPTRARGLAAAAKGPGAAQRTLDAAARNAMLDNARAVAARDERTAQAAEGIRALVDANAAELQARHAGRAVDARAAAHLNQAAFVLAAYRAVQAHVRNPAESRAMVLSMLNAHEGINSTLIRGLSLAMDPVEVRARAAASSGLKRNDPRKSHRARFWLRHWRACDAH